MLLSVCIIVRDGARHLEQTILSIKKLADEIIVIDLDSIDNSVAIARSCGAKVYQLGEELDFAVSRDFARKKAKGKWLLFLESDEELLDDYGQLRNILRVSKNDGFYLPLSQLEFLSKQKSYIKNHNADFSPTHLSFRLYQNKADYYYQGDSYQGITKSILDNNGEASLKILHLPIIKSSIHGVLPEKANIFSFLYFDIDDNMEIEKAVYHFLKAAIKHFWKHEYNLAIEKLEKASNLVGAEGRLILIKNLILVLLECKKYKRAERKIDCALKKYPYNKTIIFFQAYLEYIKGNYQDSSFLLNKIFNKERKDKEMGAKVSLLQGMNLVLGGGDTHEAAKLLEYALANLEDNHIALLALLKCKEKEGMDINEQISFIKEYNSDNLLQLIQYYYKKKKYSKIEEILAKKDIFEGNDNYLLYWQGLIDFKRANYSVALNNFKKITPDFTLYNDVLALQWILNLVMPGRFESKSVVNQVKLIGDDYNWELINFFNDIYFRSQDKILKFENLLIKLRYYNLTLYYLDYLLEFASSKAIIIMLEIIDSFKFRRSNRDIAILFYRHEFYEESYQYFSRDIEQVTSIDDVSIMLELCKELDKEEEEIKWRKKLKFMGKEFFLLAGKQTSLSNNFIL
ncbi:glycosyltransferase [Natronospora cellulosivora (SeqCode)]